RWLVPDGLALLSGVRTRAAFPARSRPAADALRGPAAYSRLPRRRAELCALGSGRPPRGGRGCFRPCLENAGFARNHDRRGDVHHSVPRGAGALALGCREGAACLARADEVIQQVMRFVALHESGCGPLPTRACATARPQLAKADAAASTTAHWLGTGTQDHR